MKPRTGLSVLCLAVCLAFGASQTHAAKASSASGSSRAGMFGIGATAIPLSGGDLKGLTADFWLNERLALEGFLGFGTDSTPGGTTAAGLPINNTGSTFGLAASGRYAIFEANDTVFFNGVGRLSFATNSGTNTTLGVASAYNNSTVGLFFGAGVEAFAPMWPSISVEASAGLNVLLTSATFPGATTSGSDIFLGGTQSLPLNVAFHYYFR